MCVEAAGIVLAGSTDGCIVSGSPLLPAAVDVVSAASAFCFVFGFRARNSFVSESSVNNQPTLWYVLHRCDFDIDYRKELKMLRYKREIFCSVDF